MWNILSFQYARRNKNLKELGYNNYQEFLKSPEWAATKQKIREKIRKGKIYWAHCKVCGGTEQIQYHHFKYKKPLTKLSQLYPLCQRCHYRSHKQMNHKIGLKAGVKNMKYESLFNVFRRRGFWSWLGRRLATNRVFRDR